MAPAKVATRLRSPRANAEVKTASRPLIALIDVGSTYTKLTAIDREGHLYARVKTLTQAGDIGLGMESLMRELIPAGGRASVDEVIACSSAGGGLRVAVVGLEPRLTLEAARRTAATAGARIVGAHAGPLDSGCCELMASSPDLVLLTGGTDGGDHEVVVTNARQLDRLDPEIPIVYAGNEQARDAVLQVLRRPRVVRLARNVLPRIGELDVEDAQSKIRSIFIDHVIGRGRLASSSPLVRAIRMATPAAVLAATRELARLARRSRQFANPVVIDVGGATTDVHSSLPPDRNQQAFGRGVVPDQQLARTVEGDLGLRENAVSLVEEAQRTGHVHEDELGLLTAEAMRRSADRGYLASVCEGQGIDARLGTLAAAIALSRHAGRLHVELLSSGAALRKSGRDLRGATCIVATGGVFAHAEDATDLVTEATRLACARGALVPPAAPVIVDRTYILSAAGLLSTAWPAQAQRILVNCFADKDVDGA